MLSVPLKAHQDKSFGRPNTVPLEAFEKADYLGKKEDVNLDVLHWMVIVARTGQTESSKLIRTLEMIKSGFCREGKRGSAGSEDISKVTHSHRRKERQDTQVCRHPAQACFPLH